MATQKSTKVCTYCKREKPLEDFHSRFHKNRGKFYYNSRCKRCHNKCSAAANRRRRRTPEGAKKYSDWKKDYRRRNPEKTKRHDRESDLRKKYGIGIAEFDALAAQQGGVCAICGTFPDDGKGLCVDHDHDSGAIRGLLCGGCNRGIGQLGDDVDRLLAAVEYLRSFTQVTL